jgi:hypothetical protein
MMAYELRVVDAELRQRLAAMGAVVIEGPKACGKTQTAMQIAGSSVLLDTDVSARRALAVEPSLVDSPGSSSLPGPRFPRTMPKDTLVLVVSLCCACDQ